jgi:hypothetical protein
MCSSNLNVLEYRKHCCQTQLFATWLGQHSKGTSMEIDRFV